MYFIKAQKSENKWWQYLITLSVVSFAYLILGGIPLGIIMALKIARNDGFDLHKYIETYDPSLLGIDQNLSLVILLTPAVLGFIVLLVLMLKLHKRKAGDIASAEGRIRWNRLFTGVFVWLIILIIADVIFKNLNPENYVFQYDPSLFFILIIIAVLIIPLQSWFEELLFRSYLLVGTGLLFRSRLIALLITSLAFGLLHSFNPEVKELGFWATMPYYVSFGVFAGLLVIFDNGIELACGVHAINNLYGAIFVTYENSVLKTPALYNKKSIDPQTEIITFLIAATLFIIIMSKMYKWGNWWKLFVRVPIK